MYRTLLVVVVLLLATPVLAQGPFNDVPTDHWAYDAVNKLQKDGIVIGYPDGTFGGKRAMSRYEFATAIARILPLINPDLSAYATKEELRETIAGIKVPPAPDLSQYATKADLDALRRLIDEFRDTLAQLGVDVDALKRDVAALAARVDALEVEQRRVRWSGDVNVFGIATAAEQGIPFDLDNRVTRGFVGAGSTAKRDTLIRNIGVVKDFDLNVVGRVNSTITAQSTINYGDYLNYIAFVDDYVGGFRPTSKAPVPGQPTTTTPLVPFGPVPPGAVDTPTSSLQDAFFPYYLYINAGLCKGNLMVGRMPLQFTPYTLKKIDVDSYTTILKTDDGNYPVDGIKASYGFGGVDLTLFAVKNDENTFLLNGLTGQPNTGLFGFDTDGFVFSDQAIAATFAPGGVNQNFHVVGNLNTPISQTAGGRLTIGTPWKGTLGLTFYQAWSELAWEQAAGIVLPAVNAFDQARVYGADLTIPFGNFGVTGSWTKSDSLVSDRNTAAGVSDRKNNNIAWDAAVNGKFGKLGIIAGYKNIGRNFAAAGAWDKIGRWTNPVAVQGPYVDISYPIARKLRLALNGEFLSMMDDVRGIRPTGARNLGWGAEDDTITYAQAGVQWGISRTNSLDLGYQWIQYSPDTAALDEAVESYITVGWAHQFSSTAGFKLGYQFINYNDGTPFTAGGIRQPGPGPYLGDYRGGLGVAQFGVSF